MMKLKIYFIKFILKYFQTYEIKNLFLNIFKIM